MASFPHDIELNEELFDTHAQVWNHIFKFMIPMSLKCAVELNIPDIIKHHGKPMTISELTNALPIDKAKSHGIHRLMRILVDYEFFTKVEIEVEKELEEGYWLTPSSMLLLKDSPSSFVTPLLLFMLDPAPMKAFSSMSEWFTGDQGTAFETAHGATLWEQAGKDTRLRELMLNEGMERHAQFESSIILKECVKLFDGVESLVDVGGGIGTLARAVADAFPEIKCTVLDLPHVVAGLEGLANLNYVGGSMFEAIPTADIVLIKGTLHNWKDADCIKILKNCKDAISSRKEKGGKLIVIDMVLGYKEDKKAVVKENKLFHDMMMMVYCNGKERSEQEWERLFLDAGFKTYKITPTLGLISIIQVYP